MNVLEGKVYSRNKEMLEMENLYNEVMTMEWKSEEDLSDFLAKNRVYIIIAGENIEGVDADFFLDEGVYDDIVADIKAKQYEKPEYIPFEEKLLANSNYDEVHAEEVVDADYKVVEEAAEDTPVKLSTAAFNTQCRKEYNDDVEELNKFENLMLDGLRDQICKAKESLIHKAYDEYRDFQLKENERYLSIEGFVEKYCSWGEGDKATDCILVVATETYCKYYPLSYTEKFEIECPEGKLFSFREGFARSKEENQKAFDREYALYREANPDVYLGPAAFHDKYCSYFSSGMAKLNVVLSLGIVTGKPFSKRK
jgi:hypothetical protein